jgi:ornithine cyclodeaminase/alanine dehydrogenase-like protein (mu-crystallin family)
MPAPPILLTQTEIERLLAPAAYIDLVEEAFARRARGETLSSRLLDMDSEIQIKASGLRGPDSSVVAVKVGADGVSGVIALFSGDDGRPLVFMESATIHRLCKTAATAVATRHLARHEAQTLTICGVGAQAAAHVDAVLTVRPIGRIVVWGRDLGKATRLAAELADRHRIDTSAATNLARATADSDIVVTLTSAREPFLGRDDIKPGTFIAAVGSEVPGRQELHPELLARASVIVDELDQSAAIGELHHAIEAGLVGLDDVRAELGDIIIGTRQARRDDTEIVVFDSTGAAVQDATVAQALYEMALRRNSGQPLPFWD